MIKPRFSLLDHYGHPVTDADYRGRWMLVYFGYTNCRKVCPRSLAKLSDALTALGEQSAVIVPLYITVDPARDTPAVMKDWLETRFPRFTGLTGNEGQIADAKASFRVFAERKPDAEEPDGYVVPHTAIAYLADPSGSYRAHFTDVVDAETIASRISEILGEDSTLSAAGEQAK